jgi:hypothetical protein
MLLCGFAAAAVAETPDLFDLRQAGGLSGACALLAGELDVRLRVWPAGADAASGQAGCGPAGEAPWLLRIDEDQAPAIQLTEEGLAGMAAHGTDAPAPVLPRLLMLDVAQSLVVVDDFSALAPLQPPRQRADCVPGVHAPGQWLMLLRMASVPGAAGSAPQPLEEQYICPMRGGQGVLLVDGNGRVGRIGISPVGLRRLAAARLNTPTDMLHAVQALVPAELGPALRDGIQVQIAYRGGQSLSLAVGNDAVAYYLK